MLTKEETDLWKKLTKEANAIGGKIESHIHHCLKEICKVFGTELDWWDYPSYDGDKQKLSLAYDEISLEIVTENYSKEMAHLGYDYSFPIRFLYMSVEDVVKEVQIELDQYREAEYEKKRKAKERREAKKKEKARLKEAAKAKLTAEEQRALGL